MIFGDELILTRKGIFISNKTLETIGVYVGTEVYLLPFRTFEYRRSEMGYSYPLDLLITPLSPPQWPFIMRFQLRLSNRPGMLEKAISFFEKLGINIIFSECTRSGHHHCVLNVLGELTRVEVQPLKYLFDELDNWSKDRATIYQGVYNTIYENIYYENDKLCNKIDLNKKPFWFKAVSAYNLYGLISNNDSDKNQKRISELSHEYGFDDFTTEIKNIIDYERDNKLEFIEKKIEEITNLQGLDNDTDIAKKSALFIGFYLSELCISKKINTVKELLEYLIKEKGRNKIDELMRDKARSSDTKKDIYEGVEKILVYTKIVLSLILTYKRMLCEKYKLLFIADSLSCGYNNEKCNGKKDSKSNNCRENVNIGDESYLYNILFYKYAISYPFFSSRVILNSNIDTKNDTWNDKVKQIYKYLDNIKSDRKGPWSWEPRLDLDPITISPLEFLCHASYHRAYDRVIRCTADEGIIPFGNSPRINRILDELFLSSNKSATFAIASRNTDDLTLRLCPLPIDTLKNIKKIDMPKYELSCEVECRDDMIKKWKNGDIFQVEKNNGEISDKRICNGTSMGLLKIIISAISSIKYNSKPLINILRVFNKKIQVSDLKETGSIHLIIHSIEKRKRKFWNKYGKSITCHFKSLVDRLFPNKHLETNNLKISDLSGGTIFVSIPQNHKMTKKWLKIIKKIGKQMGFSNINTVETVTRPVTIEVSQKIRKSQAMIQVLALPLKKYGDKNISHNSNINQELTWLHAEYLTALTTNIPVVRLIDENSIDENTLNIARDTATLKFSMDSSLGEFEKLITKAYKEIRKELASKLGLS